ncbi:MAG: hypothetical protein PHE56_10055 [Bacteroidales bacterium]|nr:hypothetical protein [Bacteroidales bacterium]
MKNLKNHVTIFISFCLLTSITSCNSGKTTVADIPEFSGSYEWKNAIIYSESFTDKGGQEHHEIKDYFIFTQDGEYFIKLSECKTSDLKIEQINAHLVRVRVKISDGLWDTNDPNVQSRVGSYAVFDSIQNMGTPISVKFADGNGNKYTITQEKIIYDPISAAESSSGVYSGGEEKAVTIKSTDFYSIFLDAYAIHNNAELHIKYREMGSYLLNIELKEKNLVKNISNCEQAKALKDKLDKFLNSVTE